LAQHGGRSNAATGEDYTYYYFDIKNDYFGEALDKFSSQFEHPLLTEDCSDREMNAVDSEFKKNLSNESRARTQIEKHHAVIPGSILNRFSTGSLESLKVPGIMDELRKFYNANYSSNLMSLVLVGR